MTGFRRLISYIYEYEGNVKGKNVGFVKLETRNGMCRLNVSVKKLYMGSSDMGVYLLTGRQEIFLGDLFLRNGCGEFRTVVQLTNVQDSGETMDGCYGLTLHGKGETWRVYTTIWEDAVAQAAQLTLENVTSENAVERDVKDGRLSSVVPEEPAREKTDAEQPASRGERDAAQPASGGGGMRPMSGDEREVVQQTPEGMRDAVQRGSEGEADATQAAREKGRPRHRAAMEGRMAWDGGPDKRTVEDGAEAGAGTGREQVVQMPETSGPAPESVRVSEVKAPEVKELTIPSFLDTTRTDRPVSGRSDKVVDFREKNAQRPGSSQPPKREVSAPGVSLPDHEMGRLEMETVYPDIPLERAAASGLFSAPALAEAVSPAPKEPVGQGRTESQASQTGSRTSLAEDQASQTGSRTSLAEDQASQAGIWPSKAEDQASQTGSRTSLAEDQASQAGIWPSKAEDQPVQAGSGQVPDTEQPPLVIRQYEEEPLIIGDPQALARLDEQEAMEKLVPVWDFFADTYPKIQAFDSEHGCQVLVIKPQDIGLLPRDIWIYGNNSFLLHGYYNYRYLILARLENPRGMPRYLLGVPGHYYSNEKYMASMFGFPHFVLSKRQPAQDGRFGYWYTDIRMEENAALGAAAVEKARKRAY